MPDPTDITTAIDLSRLPAPTVVEQLSFESVRTAIIEGLQLALPEFDATVESDPAIKLIEVFAYRELLLRQTFNDRARQLMLAYATDSNLDQLGANFNVARLILTPADPVAGVDAVVEADEDFRRRIQLSPEALSVAGPASAYRFWALSAAASIADAKAISPNPGQVVVSILSRDGDGSASANEREAVELALGSPVRPLTDQVTVVSAMIVPYEIEAEITVDDGPDRNIVLAAAQASVDAFKLDQRKLGRSINRSALFAALTVEGVANVNLIHPAADVPIAFDQCANCFGTLVGFASA